MKDRRKSIKIRKLSNPPTFFDSRPICKGNTIPSKYPGTNSGARTGPSWLLIYGPPRVCLSQEQAGIQPGPPVCGQNLGLIFIAFRKFSEHHTLDVNVWINRFQSDPQAFRCPLIHLFSRKFILESELRKLGSSRSNPNHKAIPSACPDMSRAIIGQPGLTKRRTRSAIWMRATDPLLN